MARHTDTGDRATAPNGGRVALYAAAGGALILFVGALFLWREHGLGIYMDRLASGIANCF